MPSTIIYEPSWLHSEIDGYHCQRCKNELQFTVSHSGKSVIIKCKTCTVNCSICKQVILHARPGEPNICHNCDCVIHWKYPCTRCKSRGKVSLALQKYVLQKERLCSKCAAELARKHRGKTGYLCGIPEDTAP